MRPVLTAAALGLLVLSFGCDRWVRHDDRNPIGRLPAGTPKPEHLVSYLNANAQRVRSLETVGGDGLLIDARADGQTVGLSGTVVCQKGTAGTAPNFRMQARVMNKTEVDIGSNSQEFWYWIARAPQPYVFHCSYDDYRAGRAKMPFPFQPEWIAEAMGIAETDPAKKYEVREGKTTYELVERSVSPQGQAVQKVTVFQRGEASGRSPQVVARVLQDAGGKEICSAHITEVQVDPRSGAVIPRTVKLRWPQEKMELAMTLKDVRINSQIDEGRAAGLFSRRSLTAPGYDLARGPDSPGDGIQPAGGFPR
jgi:hypothetical protein